MICAFLMNRVSLSIWYWVSQTSQKRRFMEFSTSGGSLGLRLNVTYLEGLFYLFYFTEGLENIELYLYKGEIVIFELPFILTL